MTKQRNFKKLTLGIAGLALVAALAVVATPIHGKGSLAWAGVSEHSSTEHNGHNNGKHNQGHMKDHNRHMNETKQEHVEHIPNEHNNQSSVQNGKN